MIKRISARSPALPPTILFSNPFSPGGSVVASAEAEIVSVTDSVSVSSGVSLGDSLRLIDSVTLSVTLSVGLSSSVGVAGGDGVGSDFVPL
jgi:hypothetical protein